ncbi:MAG TPA: hypothetical protein VIM70_01640 [Clostridium sp.]|uniref:hypothetical protein n=1 Tax=Clostridium sp. TaxID=1506 RepID=UPI002F95D26B
MKFNELKEKIQSGNTNLPTLIKPNYVPISSQQNIIDNIILISLSKDESGFIKIDYTLKTLFTSLYILANFTDIEFEGLTDLENNIDSALAVEFYDFCKEHGVIECVRINCDYSDFTQTLESEIAQEIELSNSVASILSQVLNKIALKLPAQGELGEIMGKLPSIISSFNAPKPKSTPRKKKVL